MISVENVIRKASNHNNLFPGPDSDPGPPKYEAEMSPS
jgi:hypothetical protein